MWWLIVKDVFVAIFTGEIKHWWLAWQAHQAVQAKLADRNIQNDALNQPPGAAEAWLKQQGAHNHD